MRTLRGRLLLTFLGALAIVLALLIGAFNVVLRDRLRRDAHNALVARAAGELAALRFDGGRLAAPETPDQAATDIQTWVFAGGRTLERPRTAAANDRAAQTLSAGTHDVAVTHTRLYAVPVVRDQRRLGTIVAAISLRPYERTEGTALIASSVLGLAILLVFGPAARLLISEALRPVARMTAQAAAWHDAGSAQRFGLGPPRDELTLLAATLDSLLERVATSLRHEQRFSAELAHELRTPLANALAQAQFAIRHATSAAEQRAAFEQIVMSAQRMSRTLDTLVAAARAELGAGVRSGDATAAARAAAQGCTAAGMRVEVVDPAGPIRVAVETDVVERVLAPLIENGCRYGREVVTVTLSRRDGSVEFCVADDGPGISATEQEAIFDAGRVGGADGGRNSGGAGLGLALARRLARAAGGDLTAEADAAGGRFVVRLPAA